MSISSRIKSLCECKKITINQLEKEIGIGRGSIARWDTNSPSINKVIPVANYFGVTIDFLLTGKQNENPPAQGGGITEEESNLIELFRQVPQEQRSAMLQAIEMTLRSQGLL